jgi:phage regulator Rha-like protein
MLDDTLRSLEKYLARRDGKREVKTIVAMTPTQIKKWNELKGITAEADALEHKRLSLRKLFWAQIESDLKEYVSDMQVSDDERSIEILGEVEPKKAVKSPFFQKGK